MIAWGPNGDPNGELNFSQHQAGQQSGPRHKWTLFTTGRISTDSSIGNPWKFFTFWLKKNVCTFLNLYFIFIFQAYKKIVNANARVFLMQRVWEGQQIWHCSFFWLPFSLFWMSWKHYLGVFLLLFDQMGMQKYFLCSSPNHCFQS